MRRRNLPDKDRPERQVPASPWNLSNLVQALVIALIVGVAGALVGAMVAGLVGWNQSGIAQAAWVLIIRGLLESTVVGIAATVIGGGVTAVFDRSSILPLGAAAGFLFFAGYALYQTALVSWGLSPWGSGIGATLGGALGMVLGLGSANERRTSPAIRRAVQRLSRSKGTHPADAEWWRAPTPTLAATAAPIDTGKRSIPR